MQRATSNQIERSDCHVYYPRLWILNVESVLKYKLEWTLTDERLVNENIFESIKQECSFSDSKGINVCEEMFKDIHKLPEAWPILAEKGNVNEYR